MATRIRHMSVGKRAHYIRPRTVRSVLTTLTKSLYYKNRHSRSRNTFWPWTLIYNLTFEIHLGSVNTRWNSMPNRQVRCHLVHTHTHTHTHTIHCSTWTTKVIGNNLIWPSHCRSGLQDSIERGKVHIVHLCVKLGLPMLCRPTVIHQK